MRPKENTTSSAVNGRAVVELDALAQVEAPLRVGDLLPARREARLGLVLLVVARQPFVGVLHHRVGGGVVLRVRVERDHVVLRRPFQVHGIGGQRRQCQDQQ
jgi:hypothetical protein